MLVLDVTMKKLNFLKIHHEHCREIATIDFRRKLRLMSILHVDLFHPFSCVAIERLNEADHQSIERNEIRYKR